MTVTTAIISSCHKNLFISPNWSSHLSFEWQLESRVVKSALLGVAAIGSGISAETALFPCSGACQQIRGSRDVHLHPVFHRHDGIIPQFSHTKLGLFSHRPDPPPVNTPEHSLPEANISKEMLSSVKLSTQWCWLPHGNTHLSSKSESYRKKCLRKQALSRSEERRVGKECRSRWSPYH